MSITFLENKITIKMTGEEASKSPVFNAVKEKFKEDINKSPELDKEIIMDDECALVSAKDWARCSFLIIPPESKQTVIKAFFENKSWSNFNYVETYQKQYVHQTDPCIGSRIPVMKELIKELIINAGGANNNIEKNPYFNFLMNKTHQGSLQTITWYVILEKLITLGLTPKTSNICLLIPNNNCIELIYLFRTDTFYFSDVSGDTKIINFNKNNQLCYQSTLKIDINKPFNEQCLTLTEVKASVPNIEVLNDLLPNVKNIIVNTINPLTGVAEKTPFLPASSSVTISDGTSLMKAITYRLHQTTLSDSQKKYLAPLEQGFKELTVLKNKLQQQYPDSEKTKAINTLCGAIVDQTVTDLKYHIDTTFSEEKRQHLCKLLSQHMTNGLKNEAIKKDDGNKLLRFVTTTLRTIASLLATLSVAPLAIPYVRHSLFRNKAERVINNNINQLTRLSP